jgi:hypothetical protein
MKKILLTLFCVFVIVQLHAQKFEISLLANSGLYHYTGSSTTSTSGIIAGSNAQQNYTNNPYGNKNGVSYGGNIQAQYIAKSGFITGLQAGYEVLRSEVDINTYYPLVFNVYTDVTGPFASPQIPVKGQSVLQNQNININPYIGYRWQTNTINIDLMPGIDLGFNIRSYDKGKATDSNGNTYQTDLRRSNAPTDVRFRLGAAAMYKKFGLTASYAIGLTNFEKNMIGDANYDARSRLFRFGISYRIF